MIDIPDEILEQALKGMIFVSISPDVDQDHFFFDMIVAVARSRNWSIVINDYRDAADFIIDAAVKQNVPLIIVSESNDQSMPHLRWIVDDPEDSIIKLSLRTFFDAEFYGFMTMKADEDVKYMYDMCRENEIPGMLARTDGKYWRWGYLHKNITGE